MRLKANKIANLYKDSSKKKTKSGWPCKNDNGKVTKKVYQNRITQRNLRERKNDLKEELT